MKRHDGLVVNNKNKKNQNRSTIFGVFYFSMYACHSRVNLPKGKLSLSVRFPLARTKFVKEFPLTFPLVLREKLREKLRDFP